MDNETKFKILIVDDVAFNIDVAVSYLADENYAISTVSSPKGALKAAFSKSYDLILLDINMPEMDGYEVCRRLKKDAVTKDIPIIFLSSMDDIDAITKAFEMGGVDYLSKPFNGLELIARVKTQLQLRGYVNELKEKQSKLAKLVATDASTGLSNKIHFMSIIKKEVALSTHNLSLIYFSIDHMQKINHLYGYKVGDKVLIKVAKVMEKIVRPRDTPARLFGSEFVILLPKTPYDDARKIVKNIYDTIKTISTSNLNIACSFGVSTFNKDSTYDDFIMRCEKLMLEAKESGGNTIVMHR